MTLAAYHFFFVGKAEQIFVDGFHLLEIFLVIGLQRTVKKGAHCENNQLLLHLYKTQYK